MSSYAPGILARGPWHAGQVAARWRDDALRAGRGARRRRRPRDRRARATAARRPTTGSPRASPATREDEDGLTLELQPHALVAAPGGRRRARRALRALRRARRRRPLARRAAAPPGWRRGRGAGRSAPAARSRSARTPRTRSRASSRRSGRCSRAARRRGARVPARTAWRCWSARPGWPTGAARHARPRARRARLVAGRSRAWPAEADDDAAPHGHAARVTARASSFRTPQVPVLRPLGGLPVAADRLARARADARRARASAGPTGWLDRHVAALHRRRPAARDPALAGRDGGRRRRRRSVRGNRRVSWSKSTGGGAARYDAVRSEAIAHGSERDDGRGRHAGDGRLGDRGHRPGMAQAGGRRRSRPTRRSSRSPPTRSTPRSPSPVAGTLVKVHAAEGDTVEVGAVLAEIAPTNGARRGRGARGVEAAATPTDDAGRPAARRREAADDPSTSSCPQMGESVTEGAILEWAKAAGRRRRGRRDDRRDLHGQGRRRGARARLRHARRDPRRRRRDGHRRPGHRAHAAGAGAARRRPPRPAPEPTSAPRPAGDAAPPRRPDDLRATPVARRVAAAHGVDLGAVTRHRARRADRQGRRARRRERRRPDRRGRAHDQRRAPAARSPPAHADQGRRRDARPLHGRVARRSRPRPRSARSPSPRSTAAASSSRTAGQRVSFTHLIAYAIARAATEQMPVMAHHFDEIDGKPHRIDDGARQPRPRRRRREEGRQRAR